MVSLSCGKINDTVEPFLILQENFMKLLKKAFAFIFIFMLSVFRILVNCSIANGFPDGYNTNRTQEMHQIMQKTCNAVICE